MDDLLRLQKIILATLLVLIWVMEGVFPFMQGRAHRWQHAARNLGLGLVNTILSGFLTVALLMVILTWAENSHFGLLRMLTLPNGAAHILAIILLDGWMYLWHRANHSIPFLWKLHRVHHRDQEMDVTTAVRFHPAEALISACLRLIVITILGLSLTQILLYDTLLIMVIFVHHSNLKLPMIIDQLLRTVITTPSLHRVHHSNLTSETNSNFGSVFSFWDRLAQTFRLRDDQSTIIYGVEGDKNIFTTFPRAN